MQQTCKNSKNDDLGQDEDHQSDLHLTHDNHETIEITLVSKLNCRNVFNDQINSMARQITANASLSKKIIESIFRQIAALMRQKKGIKFRKQLKTKLHDDLDMWVHIFNKSPSLYNHLLSKTKQE